MDGWQHRIAESHLMPRWLSGSIVIGVFSGVAIGSDYIAVRAACVTGLFLFAMDGLMWIAKDD